MTWIVLVLLACTNGECTILDQEVSQVTPEKELEMRKKCDASPNCIEPRPGFFLLRKVPEKKSPAAPPGHGVPGTRT